MQTRPETTHSTTPGPRPRQSIPQSTPPEQGRQPLRPSRPRPVAQRERSTPRISRPGLEGPRPRTPGLAGHRASAGPHTPRPTGRPRVPLDAEDHPPRARGSPISDSGNPHPRTSVPAAQTASPAAPPWAARPGNSLTAAIHRRQPLRPIQPSNPVACLTMPHHRTQAQTPRQNPGRPKSPSTRAAHPILASMDHTWAHRAPQRTRLGFGSSGGCAAAPGGRTPLGSVRRHLSGVQRARPPWARAHSVYTMLRGWSQASVAVALRDT